MYCSHLINSNLIFLDLEIFSLDTIKVHLSKLCYRDKHAAAASVYNCKQRRYRINFIYHQSCWELTFLWKFQVQLIREHQKQNTERRLLAVIRDVPSSSTCRRELICQILYASAVCCFSLAKRVSLKSGDYSEPQYHGYFSSGIVFPVHLIGKLSFVRCAL